MYSALPSPPPLSDGICNINGGRKQLLVGKHAAAKGTACEHLPCTELHSTLGRDPTQLRTWQVTQSVWHSCVFPLRNSPYSSVMDPVSMPPAMMMTKEMWSQVAHGSDGLQRWCKVTWTQPLLTLHYAAGAVIYSQLFLCFYLAGWSQTPWSRW